MLCILTTFIKKKKKIENNKKGNTKNYFQEPTLLG